MSEKKKKGISKKKKKMLIIRTKKTAAFILLIIGLLSLMQVFQLGPWSLQPGVKYPYLSYIDDPRYSMGISCGTPTGSILTLSYGENVSLQSTISEPKATTVHQFNLTGLKPNTKYYWKITCADSSITLDFLNTVRTFKTAPEPSSATPFNFTLVGDTRPDVFGISRFPRLMTQMLAEKPSFMINVGDIVMGPGFTQQWDRFFWDIRGCADIGAPYMVGLGNHEWNEYDWIYGDDKGVTYKYYMNYPHNEAYYAYNYSNAAFISIDNNANQITDTQVTQVESWLDAANKSADIDWIFVFGHYPVYHGDGKDSYVEAKFEHLFRAYNVDMYLAGHVHHYARSIVNGTTYIISGGGGAELGTSLENPSHVVSSALTFQYCTISINEKSLTYKSISHVGEVIDQVTLTPRKG